MLITRFGAINMTKQDMLQMLAEGGGATTEYPFIEYGLLNMLDELVEEGLLLRIPRDGDLDEVRITQKGREFLSYMDERK
jgi:hypothetical protein